jgi:extracellular elastinolytic metalloproteinase
VSIMFARARLGSLTLLVAGATALTALSPAATSAQVPQTVSSPAAEQPGHTPERLRNFDLRYPTGVRAQAAGAEVVAKAASRPAMQKQLASEKFTVDIDSVTGTPRWVGDIQSGHLTDASNGDPKQIVLDFMKANLTAFGLAPGDLRSLKFRNDYVDIVGTHHLSWQHKVGGVPVFGFGLKAAVDKKGRVIMVGGSPIPAALLPASPVTTKISAAQAIASARKAAGDKSLRSGPGDNATKVIFVTRGKAFTGWQTITMSSRQPTQSVYDAATAQLLYRRNLGHDQAAVERPTGDARGVAFRNYPGAPKGSGYRKVNFTKKGWLAANARKLSGNNAHAFSDLNDNNKAGAKEEVGPKKGQNWNYKLQTFKVPFISYCSDFPCSWHPNRPFSWRVNRAQNTTQAFYFVNTFHDYLLKKPIGFTEDAGNFQKVNATGEGKGKDAVQTQTLDGANTDNGLPDGAHLNNANMSTPPDGQAPVMQLYLQHFRNLPYDVATGDPFPANNTGDASDTVYHEYVHGLSDRLVVDPAGNSGLVGAQGYSMGEGWSDWYALDYLVGKGLDPDQAQPGDVKLGDAEGLGQALVRTAAIDCPVNDVTAPECQNPGDLVGHPGGYTYADFGDVIGTPEVHADGEIWAQMLWDLRTEVTPRVARMLVTRAMELAPFNPSYLDMRNAMLVADHAAYEGDHGSAVWRVFANRGMGYFAGSFGGSDVKPAADFNEPPVAGGDTGLITGTVTDVDTGQPIAGIVVSLAFQGAPGQVNPTAITDASGSYSLGPVPAGEYGKLAASGSGYEPQTTTASVTAAGLTQDFSVRRDWAAASGGGSVESFAGPDFTPFCGPDYAIDLSLATGWGSTTGDDAGTPTDTMIPKEIVIKLPQAVDISVIGVDPGATCGDGISATTGEYQIELSPDGTTWTQAAAGHFTRDDAGRINEVTPTAGATGAQFLRFTMLGNQVVGPNSDGGCPTGSFSGCSFTDLSEITVYGTSP